MTGLTNAGASGRTPPPGTAAGKSGSGGAETRVADEGVAAGRRGGSADATKDHLSLGSYPWLRASDRNFWLFSALGWACVP
jgi:hypothetical protein